MHLFKFGVSGLMHAGENFHSLRNLLRIVLTGHNKCTDFKHDFLIHLFPFYWDVLILQLEGFIMILPHICMMYFDHTHCLTLSYVLFCYQLFTSLSTSLGALLLSILLLCAFFPLDSTCERKPVVLPFLGMSYFS
jgi:hypothetical protein